LESLVFVTVGALLGFEQWPPACKHDNSAFLYIPFFVFKCMIIQAEIRQFINFILNQNKTLYLFIKLVIKFITNLANDQKSFLKKCARKKAGTFLLQKE